MHNVKQYVKGLNIISGISLYRMILKQRDRHPDSITTLDLRCIPLVEHWQG